MFISGLQKFVVGNSEVEIPWLKILGLEKKSGLDIPALKILGLKKISGLKILGVEISCNLFENVSCGHGTKREDNLHCAS